MHNSLPPLETLSSTIYFWLADPFATIRITRRKRIYSRIQLRDPKRLALAGQLTLPLQIVKRYAKSIFRSET